jgi:hypothetical protein
MKLVLAIAIAFPCVANPTFNALLSANNVIDPATLANRVLGLDADTIPGADASAVALWEDDSAENNDCAQATVGRRPLLQTSEVNSHSAVEFDGGAPTLYTFLASTTWEAFSAQTGFIVFKWIDGNNYKRAFTQSDASEDAATTDSLIPLVQSTGVGSTTWGTFLQGDFRVTTTITASTWYVFAWRDNGTTLQCWLNGTSLGTYNHSAWSKTFTRYLLGSDTAGATGFHGFIANSQVYSDSKTDGDVLGVTRYLGQRYGITIP